MDASAPYCFQMNCAVFLAFRCLPAFSVSYPSAHVNSSSVLMLLDKLIGPFKDLFQACSSSLRKRNVSHVMTSYLKSFIFHRSALLAGAVPILLIV